MNYQSEQEVFWAGEFGNDYIARNNTDELLASNLHFFSNALNKIGKIESVIELGANVGMNLRALKLLYPMQKQFGIEINQKAHKQLASFLGAPNTFNGSIFDFKSSDKFDLALIKGVLIHINPEMLDAVYQSLYSLSARYIMIAEYYNRTPIEISYRGHSGKLFKRDFCGELLDKFPDLQLINYGFSYHRDKAFPQDDITWFLMEKMDFT